MARTLVDSTKEGRRSLAVLAGVVLFGSMSLCMVIVPPIAFFLGAVSVSGWATLLTSAVGFAVALRHWLNLTSSEDAKVYASWDSVITVAFVTYCLAVYGIL